MTRISLLRVTTTVMGVRVVLYVEDDDLAFSLAKIVLDEENPPVQLIRARDGDQALAILLKTAPYESARTPDLILLDLNLPKKNGIEVLADLKAAETLRSIPVVMFSTSTSGRDRSESLALGAEDFITKGWNLDPFTDALKKALVWTGPAGNQSNR